MAGTHGWVGGVRGAREDAVRCLQRAVPAPDRTGGRARGVWHVRVCVLRTVEACATVKWTRGAAVWQVSEVTRTLGGLVVGHAGSRLAPLGSTWTACMLR